MENNWDGRLSEKTYIETQYEYANRIAELEAENKRLKGKKCKWK